MSVNQFSNRYNLQIHFMQYFSVRTAVLDYIWNKIKISPVSLANNIIPFNVKTILKAIKAVEICKIN